MDNLCYKPLNAFADLINGYAFKSKNYVKNGIRVIRIANVQDGYISDEKPCFYPADTAEDISKYILRENDFLVSLTGNVGRVAILSSDFLPAALNQRISCIRIKNDALIPKFLFYYFLRKQFQKDCINASQGVAQLNLSTKWLEQYPVPVLSIEEQKRIVAKIEEMFSELDNGVETLKKTKQQLAVYRQAVLKEAFDSVIECEMGTIQSTCSNIVDCPHSTPKWVDEGKICLRTTNFKRGYLDLTEKNYVSKETFDKRNARLVPQPGDVLYSREGAILGIACMIPKGLSVCLGQRMMLLRTNERMIGRFLMYYLNSPVVTSFVNTKIGGSASPHVNVGDIKEFKVPIPSIGLQRDIVERIESQLSVCDSIERTVDTALQQAEAMRQSILKKAFEGEL